VQKRLLPQIWSRPQVTSASPSNRQVVLRGSVLHRAGPGEEGEKTIKCDLAPALQTKPVWSGVERRLPSAAATETNWNVARSVRRQIPELVRQWITGSVRLLGEH
jgi:hypothetical protein